MRWRADPLGAANLLNRPKPAHRTLLSKNALFCHLLRGLTLIQRPIDPRTSIRNFVALLHARSWNILSSPRWQVSRPILPHCSLAFGSQHGALRSHFTFAKADTSDSHGCGKCSGKAAITAKNNIKNTAVRCLVKNGGNLSLGIIDKVNRRIDMIHDAHARSIYIAEVTRSNNTRPGQAMATPILPNQGLIMTYHSFINILFKPR